MRTPQMGEPRLLPHTMWTATISIRHNSSCYKYLVWKYRDRPQFNDDRKQVVTCMYGTIPLLHVPTQTTKSQKGARNASSHVYSYNHFRVTKEKELHHCTRRSQCSPVLPILSMFASMRLFPAPPLAALPGVAPPRPILLSIAAGGFNPDGREMLFLKSSTTLIAP